MLSSLDQSSILCGSTGKANKPDEISVSLMDIPSGLLLYRPEATDEGGPLQGRFIVNESFRGGSGDLQWFMDEAAASKLTTRTIT